MKCGMCNDSMEETYVILWAGTLKVMHICRDCVVAGNLPEPDETTDD